MWNKEKENREKGITKNIAEFEPNIWVGQDVNNNYAQQVEKSRKDILELGGDLSGLTQRVTTNETNIATNATDIATNTANITQNTNNIASNTSNIATNETNIATNTSNITQNTNNIASNTSNLAFLASKGEASIYFKNVVSQPIFETETQIGIGVIPSLNTDLIDILEWDEVTGQGIIKENGRFKWFSSGSVTNNNNVDSKDVTYTIYNVIGDVKLGSATVSIEADPGETIEEQSTTIVFDIKTIDHSTINEVRFYVTEQSTTDGDPLTINNSILSLEHKVGGGGTGSSITEGVIKTDAAEGVGANQKEININKETRLSEQEAAFNKTDRELGTASFGFNVEGNPIIRASDGSASATFFPGSINFFGKRVVGINTPTQDTDAANKEYIDNAIKDKAYQTQTLGSGTYNITDGYEWKNAVYINIMGSYNGTPVVMPIMLKYGIQNYLVSTRNEYITIKVNLISDGTIELSSTDGDGMEIYGVSWMLDKYLDNGIDTIEITQQ